MLNTDTVNRKVARGLEASGMLHWCVAAQDESDCSCVSFTTEVCGYASHRIVDAAQCAVDDFRHGAAVLRHLVVVRKWCYVWCHHLRGDPLVPASHLARQDDAESMVSALPVNSRGR